MCYGSNVMVKQKLLSNMFTSISKIDMEVSAEWEFVTLGTQLKLKHIIKKEVVKRVVGRPEKELEVVLTTTVEKPQTSSQKRKIRGSYIIWYIPLLWDDSIYAA
jgi:hypothetical protein